MTTDREAKGPRLEAKEGRGGFRRYTGGWQVGSGPSPDLVSQLFPSSITKSAETGLKVQTRKLKRNFIALRHVKRQLKMRNSLVQFQNRFVTKTKIVTFNAFT